MNLFPTDFETETIDPNEIQSAQPVGYRNGVAFDFESSDFLRDGKNRMMDSTGVESWKSWCTASILTERYKHLAYSTDFGIELEPVFAASSREEAESILTRQITEALLADPYERTEYVEDITFDWVAADAVQTRVKVKGRNGVSIDILAYITKGEA